jgi:hypothetical protein
MSEDDTVSGRVNLGDTFPSYVVTAAKDGIPSVREFEGARAFAEASEYYDELRLDPGVQVIHFHRQEGGQLAWAVPPIKRGEDGQWVPERKK